MELTARLQDWSLFMRMEFSDCWALVREAVRQMSDGGILLPADPAVALAEREALGRQLGDKEDPCGGDVVLMALPGGPTRAARHVGVLWDRWRVIHRVEARENRPARVEVVSLAVLRKVRAVEAIVRLAGFEASAKMRVEAARRMDGR